MLSWVLVDIGLQSAGVAIQSRLKRVLKNDDGNGKDNAQTNDLIG